MNYYTDMVAVCMCVNIICPSVQFSLVFQQGAVDVLEAGPLFGIPPPAAVHEAVDCIRTAGRPREVDLSETQSSTAILRKNKV